MPPLEYLALNQSQDINNLDFNQVQLMRPPIYATAPVLEERLNAALEPSLPIEITPRDAKLPGIPGKTHAVIGMRRAGKTTYLRQLLVARACPRNRLSILALMTTG